MSLIVKDFLDRYSIELNAKGLNIQESEIECLTECITVSDIQRYKMEFIIEDFGSNSYEKIVEYLALKLEKSLYAMEDVHTVDYSITKHVVSNRSDRITLTILFDVNLEFKKEVKSVKKKSKGRYGFISKS